MNVRAFLASLLVVLLAVATVGLVTGREAEPQTAVPAPEKPQASESGWSPKPAPTRLGRDRSDPRPVVDALRSVGGPAPGEAAGEDTTTLTTPSHIPTNDQVPAITPGTGHLLSLPVLGRRTSRFGMRFHPILRVWKLHSGLDFAAPCGTPVGAAAAGVVVRTGWAGGNGVQVVVENGVLGSHRVRTTYNHLSSIGVRVGDHVAVHQGLGRVGSTGYSTGCHLHFEVIADGSFTDPEPWLNGKPVIVDLSSMTSISRSSSLSPSPSVVPSTATARPAIPQHPSSSAPATSRPPVPGTPSSAATASPSRSPHPGSPSPSVTPHPDQPSPSPSASAQPSASGSPSEPPSSAASTSAAATSAAPAESQSAPTGAAAGQASASSRLVHCIPNASATPWHVMLPAAVLRPLASAASARSASRHPWSASRSA